jgi:hypothetical protein
LGWGRRRRNRGGDSRQSCDILTFADGIIDGLMMSVVPSAILTVIWSHHYTEIPVWIPRWFRRWNRPQKLPRQRTASFLNSIYSVCNSVGIYRSHYSFSKYLPNYKRNSIDRIILSVIPLVLGEFLVVKSLYRTWFQFSISNTLCHSPESQTPSYYTYFAHVPLNL